jgi:DNA-binding NarL/FixJ family response regulator
VRVVIAEDNVMLAEGLTLLLASAGWHPVATVVDGPSLVDAVAEHEPDVAIVDVRLPPTFRDEGIRAALTIRRRRPGPPVLVFSQYVEETYAAELLADGRGGVGYLLKDRVSRVEEFLDALRRVAAGGTAIDPEVIAQVLVRRADPLAALTHVSARSCHSWRRGTTTPASPAGCTSPSVRCTNTWARSSASSGSTRPTAGIAGSALFSPISAPADDTWVWTPVGVGR